jgi:hypothetical protein
MGVSAAVVGSAVVGAAASNSAAKKQAGAANDAAEMTQEQSAQMRSDLGPYRQAGQEFINPLTMAMGYARRDDGMLIPDQNSILQQQFQFNPQDLENTPGYQFTLQQGLRGTNNALAAQGLGLSGAQAKGLSQYTTGLANQTYGDQYNRALSGWQANQQQALNNVNNLQGVVNMGQNSAAQTGQAGLAAANNAGNYLTQAGNAQASGIMGMGNAVNSGVNNYMLYNALYK